MSISYTKQTLNPQDFESRIKFCHWIHTKYHHNCSFISKVLFTDETRLTREDVINFNNNHAWTDENPHEIIESRFQDKLFIIVWAVILNHRLIRPYFMIQHLNEPA